MSPLSTKTGFNIIMSELVKRVLIMAVLALLAVSAYNISSEGFERAQAAHDALITLHKLEYPQNER